MKRLLKIFASEFWKNKVLKISYIVFTILFFALQVYFFAIGVSERSAFVMLDLTLAPSLFYLIFYMFIGYEYFSSTRTSHFQECAGGIHLGVAKIYGAKLLVLAGLVLLPFLICLSFLLGGGLLVSRDPSYLMHLAAHICLNLFLLPIIGILAGAAFSLFANRLAAYLLLFLLVIGFSPFLDKVISSIHTATGADLTGPLRLFSVITPSLLWRETMQYGLSLRPYRIFILLFWVFLLAGCFLYRLSRYQKRRVFQALTAAALVLCIGCIPFATRPNSDLIKNVEKIDGILQDVDYYSQHTGQPISTAGSSDFQITKYKMDLTIDRLLRANVTVSVDRPELGRYLFTLYHGYKIGKVLDQDGAPLPFRQEGDLIEVTKTASGPVQAITFSYEGYSPIFYSNGQGAFLPGYFAFYPHSGVHDLYDDENMQFNRMILDKATPFEVTVSTAKTCYSNLEATGHNQFAGETTGLTLMSGFINETEVGGTRVVKAFLEESDEKVKANPPKYLQDHPYKTVMTIPVINTDYYLQCCDFGDYLLVPRFQNSDQEYGLRNIARSKWQLYVVTHFYQDNREEYDWEIKSALEDPDKQNDSIYLLFDQKLSILGEEKLLSLCKTYLNDEKDTRTIQEFLNQI